MVDRFNDQYQPGQQYGIDGALLNKQARDNNAWNFGWGSGDTHKAGPFHSRTFRGPVTIGLAVVTAVEVTALPSADPRSHPENSKDTNTYIAQMRYFDHGRGEWREDSDKLVLDASGYFEGIWDEVGEQYLGRVVAFGADREVPGPGYGRIPLYRVGDVVPAYFDRQRSRLVPLHSPPDEAARAFFEYEGPPIAIKEGTAISPNYATEDTVIVSIDVLYPNEIDWVVADVMCIRVPFVLEGEEWCDSRSAFTFIDSRPGGPTLIRMRVLNTASFSLNLERAMLHVYQAGRKFFEPFTTLDHAEYGDASVVDEGPFAGTVIGDWKERMRASGRFTDQPYVFPAGSSLVRIEHLSDADSGLFGIEYRVSIKPAGGGISEQSASSTSSMSESSQWDVSSASSQSDDMSSMSSSSQFSESSLSSASSASSSSTSSIIESHSSQSQESSSFFESLDENYCCTTVVTDIKCDGFGAVLQVCYQTICFAVPPELGKSQACGFVWCVPCKIDDADESSSASSSSSTTSESSQSYLPGPPPEGGSQAVLCPEVPLEEAINIDCASLPLVAGKQTLDAVLPKESYRISEQGAGTSWDNTNTYLGGDAGDYCEWFARDLDPENVIFGVTSNSAPTATNNNVEFEYGIEARVSGVIRIHEGAVTTDIAGSGYQDGDTFAIRRRGTGVDIEQNGQVIRAITGDAGNTWRPMATFAASTTAIVQTFGIASNPTWLSSLLTTWNDVGDPYWDAVILNNQLDLVLIANGGSGTVTLNQNTGEIEYQPTVQELADGYCVEVEVLVCDGTDDQSSVSADSEQSSHSSSSLDDVSFSSSSFSSSSSSSMTLNTSSMSSSSISSSLSSASSTSLSSQSV